MAEPIIHLKTSIEIFPDRVERLLDSADGPVGLAVQAAAETVLQKAIPLVGKTYSGTTGKVIDVRPGKLMNSGSVVPLGGAAFAVVFTHPIALMHHNGKRSGYTIPKSEGSYLLRNPNSPSRSGGGKFRAIGPVTWTGKTGGNPFLIKAAASVGLKPSGTLLRGKRPAAIFRLRQP